MAPGTTQAILAMVERGTNMQTASGAPIPRRCAYCQEPFYVNSGRLRAVPAGDHLVCIEFCAQALREEAHLALKPVS
jgi:hypothetical protein